MTGPPLRELLDVAIDAAWVAGRHALAYFNTDPAVDVKADGTPVTVADQEAEEVLRGVIGRAFPGHAILGEEGGETPGDSPVRWVLDPIDGTKTFVAGVPLWGVLVGVELHGEPVAGVIYLPALDEMVSAARGEGCRWNGRPARVSEVDRLADALLVTTSPRGARAHSPAHERLAGAVGLERGWGDCYGYALVATGRAEIALDHRVAVWDCTAVLPIVEEAGGRFTDWRGRRTPAGGDAVATNGRLHDEALAYLAPQRGAVTDAAADAGNR